mgnify:FL=1
MRLFPTALFFASLVIGGSLRAAEPIEQDALHDDVVPAGAASTSPAPRVERTSVTIDWSRLGAETSRRHFSINASLGARPPSSAHPGYQAGMAYMNAGVLRYHKGIVSRALFDPKVRGGPGWIDVENRRWNREKIREAFEAFTPAPGTDIVVNIAYWPPWLEKDKRLDPERHEEFAEFCAELVRILNIEQKRGVRYFEITNERDFVYWRAQLKTGEPPLVAEFAKIFLRCAEAMKRVDPTIKTGGPAAASGEENVFPFHREFVALTLPQLDFFSFHGYATGTADQPDDFIYDKTRWLGKLIARHRRLLDELSPDRHIELHFNEYNIAWTWRIDEPRMRNHKGAVFDSLLLISAFHAGADVTNAWNDQERVYGKLDPQNDFALRLGAHVFHYFNGWLVGRSVAATSEHPSAVVPFAVRSADGHAFVLVNRSATATSVDLSFAGADLSAASADFARISETGLETDRIGPGQLVSPLVLPPHSVSFYRIGGD